MNANRRLEEFILKLNIRHNEHGLFDKINELKLKSYFNDLKMSEDNFDNKSNNIFACNIDKK
jgi:hypothetical protein